MLQVRRHMRMMFALCYAAAQDLGCSILRVPAIGLGGGVSSASVGVRVAFDDEIGFVRSTREETSEPFYYCCFYF